MIIYWVVSEASICPDCTRIFEVRDHLEIGFNLEPTIPIAQVTTETKHYAADKRGANKRYATCGTPL